MRLRALLAVPLLAAFALSAAEPPAKRPLTVDDIWAVVRVGRPVVSPDGRTVVYPRTTWEAEKNRNLTDLWLQPLAGGPGRRLTSHEAGESAPAFSPDGTRLAFVSKRDGDKEAQLYVLRLDGGEAERWTEMPMARPVAEVDGGREADRLRVVGPRRESGDDEGGADAAREGGEDAGEGDGLREPPRAVLGPLARDGPVDAPLRSRRRDAEGDRPDARDEAARAARRRRPRFRRRARRLRRLRRELHRAAVPDDEHRPLPRAGRGGAPRNLTADNPAEDGSPVFSPDGRTIAYGREAKADGWPDRTRLALLDLATGKTRILTEEWDSVPDDWSFTPDGKTLVFRAEVRARTNVFALPIAGGTPRLVWKGGRATSLARGRGHGPRLRRTRASAARRSWRR